MPTEMVFDHYMIRQHAIAMEFWQMGDGEMWRTPAHRVGQALVLKGTYSRYDPIRNSMVVDVDAAAQEARGHCIEQACWGFTLVLIHGKHVIDLRPLEPVNWDVGLFD